MKPDLVTRIVESYSYKPAKLLQPEKGYRNESHPVALEDGRIVNLILYKHEPDILGTIRNANRVSDFLADSGLPARRTVDSRIITLHVLNNNANRYRYAAL